MNLVDRIKKDEGFSRFVYQCTGGKATLGYGFNIDPRGGAGIPESVAELWLRRVLIDCEADLVDLFGAGFWDGLDQVRRNALINMRFNLGPAGFRTFKRMIEAIKQRSWHAAAQEAKDSRWYFQAGRSRVVRICEEIRDGVALS